MLTLTHQDSYKHYMQLLADRHVDLHWFKFGDEEAVREDDRTAMKEFGLWADEHEPVRLRDDLSDNYLGQYKAPIIVMKPRPERIALHQAIYDQAEPIVKDIISKLITDYHAGSIATSVSEYQFGKAEFEEEGTRFIGCRLDISWIAPVDITYRHEKWQ